MSGNGMAPFLTWTEAENQGHLSLVVETKESVDHLALGMLEKNQLEYFISPRAHLEEDLLHLDFDTPPARDRLLEDRVWTKAVFFQFLESLLALGQEADDFLLIKEEISWDPDLIYWQRGHLRLVYLPIRRHRIELPLSHFLQQVLLHGRFEGEDSSYLPHFLNLLHQKDISFPELAVFLKKEEGETKKEKEVVEESHASFLGKEEALEGRPDTEFEEPVLGADAVAWAPSDLFEEAQEGPVASPKEAGQAQTSSEPITLFGLLTHFSKRNWQRYRQGKKCRTQKRPSYGNKKEKGKRTSGPQGGETQLLAGPGDQLWWKQEAAHFSLSQEFTIGSDPENTLVLPSAFISRHHARFGIQNGNRFIEDLASSNGTFVNDQRLKAHEPYFLKADAKIRLAEEEFLFLKK